MRTFTTLLACLLCAGQARRLQSEVQSDFYPAAAFQVTGAKLNRRFATESAVGNRANAPVAYGGGWSWNKEPAWKKTSTATKQDFLEFEPYFDKSEMPDGLFKPKAPYEAKIVSVKRIVGPTANGETCDVIIDHGGNVPYIEGQSYGVLPPGVSPKTGKPNKVRLYSIASSRYGDDQTGTTTTLCVKRAEYWEEVDGKWQTDPAKKGVCSNYLCDLNCGDLIKITGPVGKVMLLPEDKPETDIIMAATGTGIAPFRSFLKRMFVDKTPYSTDFKGLAWLFLGVYNTDAILYDDEWKSILKTNPDQFRYDLALSEEMKNKDGGPMYVQHKMEEYADEIYDRMENGAEMYLCGLKGMVPGIQELLSDVAAKKGVDFEEWFKKLKKNGQWHVEVY